MLLQVLVVLSSAEQAKAVLVDAYTGAIEREEDLPSAVTHVLALPESTDRTRRFLMTAIAAPFPERASAFAYPRGVALDAERPEFFWAADYASGVGTRTC